MLTVRTISRFQVLFRHFIFSKNIPLPYFLKYLDVNSPHLSKSFQQKSPRHPYQTYRMSRTKINFDDKFPLLINKQDCVTINKPDCSD